MTRSVPLCKAALSLAALSALTSPALAHDGFHPHPHAASVGVILAALLGLGIGYLLPLLRRRA